MKNGYVFGKYTIGYTLDMGIYQQYWGYIEHIIVLYWTIVGIHIYIYIYWIWEYTDDILLMLVILKILDILMIYYSYWDILLDVVY